MQNRDKSLEQALAQYPFPFFAFIERLKHQGFIIGVDHYLRLLMVLERLGPSYPPDRLKYMLCPLFAVNQQQQQFCRLFDAYAGMAEIQTKQAVSPVREKDMSEPEPPDAKPKIYWLAGILLMLFAALAIWQFGPKPEVKRLEPAIRTVPGPGKTTSDIKRRDNIVVPLPLSLELIFYQIYGRTIRWTSIISPLVFSLLYTLYRSGRRSFALQCGQGAPPYIWPIKVETDTLGFLTGKPFFNIARRLRRRVESGVLRLDVDQSVSGTIRRGGYPQMHYQPITRPPEYLLLVDMTGHNDHQTRFIQSVSRALKNEGLFVHAYFYTRDPQICFKEPGQARFRFSDLSSRFGGHRLILVGSTDALIDPVTGQPDSWLSVLDAWPERTLFTFKRLADWGPGEYGLARNFLVLPACLDSLLVVVNAFESTQKAEVRFRTEDKTVPAPVPHALTDDLQAVRDYLEDEAVFQWLCACAVYPELNWSLTLYLSSLDDLPVTEAGLLKLVRLPWFRSGMLPDDLRLKLIDCIEPEPLNKIRQAIFQILKDDPPPGGSAAWDIYELNLAVEQWMVSPEKRKYLKPFRDNERLLMQDPVLVKILDSGRASRLSIILPPWLRKHLFRNSMPLFGLKNGVTATLAFLISLALYLAIPVPHGPTPSVTQAVSFEFAHIPAGTFMMGSPKDEPQRERDEILHEVTLTRDFYMQTTEVTQRQWQAVMGENRSYFKDCGPNCPVELVTWENTQKFISRLNQLLKTKIAIPQNSPLKLYLFL